MNISTEITRHKNLRSHIVTGVITASVLKKYLAHIYSSSDQHAEMDVFWDLTEADFSAISTNEVRDFVEYVSNQWGKKRKSKAALVVSGDLDYGLSRMFQIMIEGTTSNKVSVFKGRHEAKRWIESHD